MIHSIRPHKITSIVHRLDLGPVVDYTTDGIESRVGQVLVVRALEEKRVYDVVELTTGRMAHVAKGDVLVGALGRRDALRGFVVVMAICALASLIAIRMALKVDPAEAIGG